MDREAREFTELDAGQSISGRVLHEYLFANHLFDVIGARERCGWTVLATDVWGLPWFEGARPYSHGTWAAHDACEVVQKLTAGRIECRVCPPAPGSRSNRAPRDDPHLLYLVREAGSQVRSCYEGRVKAHLSAGAEARSSGHGTRMSSRPKPAYAPAIAPRPDHGAEEWPHPSAPAPKSYAPAPESI